MKSIQRALLFSCKLSNNLPVKLQKLHEKQFTTEASKKKNNSQESSYLYARAYLKKSRMKKKGYEAE